MNKYDIKIEIKGNELKDILDELTAAQDKIYECYSKLQSLGLLTITRHQRMSPDGQKVIFVLQFLL